MQFLKTTLANGLRIITVPMPDNPSVTVLVMVDAGSKYETKKLNGLSHFLEHMVFKGTTRRPKASDISRELDSIGSQYNAFTGQEFTGYYAKAASHRLDSILDIVSDMYLNPLFDEKEMEKEKGVIIEEIRMYQDLPQHRVQDLFTSIVYGDQPAGWNVAGTEANVKAFTRDDLSSYRSNNYVSSATTIVVSGSFDADSIQAKIMKYFSSVSTNTKDTKIVVVESQNAPKVGIEFKETDQTHIVIGVRTFPVLDPRIPVMSVLSAVLGKGMSSRLFSKMRDQLGICYYVKTSHDASTDHGVLTISAGLDNSRVEEGVKGILEECTRLKAELVGDAELKKAKDYISGNTLLELETSDARAEFAGFQEVMKKHVELPEEIISRIQKVTAEDVRKLAQDIFVDSGLNLAVVGRFKDEEVFRKYLRV